jgi:hypothetical protein
LATDAGHLRFPIADFQLDRLLAGLTRLELAISASTVQRFDPAKLQPRIMRLLQKSIGNWQSQIGNALGGPKGVEPSLTAVTVRCSAN